MDLERLPVELLIQICSYLEAFTISRLSMTCRRFEEFFTNNSICKKLRFKREFGLMGSFEEIRHLVRINKKIITHLDLSFMRWFNKSQIQNLVRTISNLAHLNLIETGFSSEQISWIIKDCKSITSLGMSYDAMETLAMSVANLKQLHLYANEESRIFIRDESFAHLEELKLTSCHNTVFIQGDYSNLKEMFIEIINPMQGADIIFTKATIGLPPPRENFLIYIEGIQNIYVSGEYFSELPRTRFSRTQGTGSVIKVNDAINYNQEHYVIAHYCNKSSPLHVERFNKKVKRRILMRLSNILCFYGAIFCPIQEFIPRHIPEKNTVTTLSIHACCLKSLVNSFDETLLENRKRVSKLFKAPIENCALNKILSITQNVETLQIRGYSNIEFKCRYSSSFLNSSYLSSISKLKNLKYLNLSFAHFLRPDILGKIFENCTFLSTLLVNTGTEDACQMMYMTRKISLCKNLKNFTLECCTNNIRELLRNLSDCPLLEIVFIRYKSSMPYAKDQDLDETTACNLIKKCSRLGVLTVLFTPIIPVVCSSKRQRKIEKVLRSIRPNMDVNLSIARYHREGLADMVGNFV